MSASILAINAGSSSLKFALYSDDNALTVLGRGEVSGLGTGARLKTQVGDAASFNRALEAVATPRDALQIVLDWITLQFPQVYVSAIGHRVVHGGARFDAPVVATAQVIAELEALDPLAPQHQPYNLAAVRELSKRFPQALPVACFDTAFHSGWSDAARRIAVPRKFHDAGVRRYGFHGLSYEFLSQQVRQLAPNANRVVLAHLGSGASICATRDGRSVDSTMGFFVLDGLPMATRSGAIDPGVVFHLHRQYGLSFDQIEHMLYYDSGLKGISGISADVRVLLESDTNEAKQAIDLFVYQCVRAIGAMAAVLGGIDVLVFSGGIGAQATQVRAEISSQLAVFGVELDETANADGGSRVSSSMSDVVVLALTTNEELVIARHCRGLLQKTGARPAH